MKRRFLFQTKRRTSSKTNDRSRYAGALLFALVATIVPFGCYHNVFGLEYETCDEVNAAMKEELRHLQACSVDADCGQVLEGTSCGCTNEVVVRNEYDVARFYALKSRAEDLKCAATTTDCSCPAADGFVCAEGVCGWNYVK